MVFPDAPAPFAVEVLGAGYMCGHHERFRARNPGAWRRLVLP